MNEKQFISQGKISDVSKCIICNNEEDLTEFHIRDNIYVSAHNLCIEGIRALLSGKSYEITDYPDVHSLIKVIDSHPVLVRRDLPYKGLYILGYLAFFKEEPKYTVEVSDWLKANGIRIANTSDSLRKLMLDGKVARVPSEDSKLRYVITKSGYAELLIALEGE